MKKGLFISLEGGEGGGKTSQFKYLCEKIKTRGIDCIGVREPGGTTTGERIRSIILDPETQLSSITEMFLFMAARSELVNTVIKPALDEGKVVISDRFIDSSVVYQGIARGLGADMVEQVATIACQGIIPDRTFLLDVDVETGLTRAKRNTLAEEGKFEQETVAFHETIRKGFLDRAVDNPQRFMVINTVKNNFDSVSQQIWELVELLLKQR